MRGKDKQDKLRVVDVCAYFTYPWRSGGQKRVHCMNKALSRHVVVEQFSFTPVFMRRKTLRHTPGYTEHIMNRLVYTKAVILLKLISITHYDFIIPLAFSFIPMPKSLKLAMAEADVIQVEHPWLLSWAKRHAPKGKPIVLVSHNVELRLQERFFEGKPFRDSIVKSIMKTEQEAVKSADSVIALSDGDRKTLSALYGARLDKIVTIENGAGEDTKPKLSKAEARRRLGLSQEKEMRRGLPIALFIGSEHPPNDEAVRFIEEELAPKMKDVLFLIVGGVRPKGTSKSAGACGNVMCTGKVEDLSIPCAAADLAINPVTSGSGASLKMFSYLSVGLPVISTRMGARGLPQEAKSLLVQSSRGGLEGFGKNIIRLINNPALRRSLGQRGGIVARKHSWGVAAKKAQSIYCDLRCSALSRARE
ncbi:glycosyltransferase family 4 protein [Candidatus Woesearchaeota archaeon]|nr:glycosyltransferase family 4 protein [Candidatus Woesearchaeota archaeon]